MAMSVGEVYMGLNLDSRKYKKSLQQMQTHTDGATNRMGSTFKKLGGVIAGAFAVGAVVHFGKASVKASEEAVVAETKLATVMRQRAGATNAQIKSINDLTVSEQALGVVEDDVSKSGAQQLGTFINTADSLKTLIPTMNNLLAQQKGLNATHEDAINIGNLMGKAMQGQTSSLKRVGITFSEAEANVMKYGNESQRAAMLSQIITNNVGQMNKALAATPYGQITQLKNNFGDLMENIGAGLMNLLMPMLKLLNNIIMKLQVVANGFKNFASAITGVNNDALGGIATDATNASDNILDIGDSAEETATKIEKSLAGFDEINKLSDNSSAVAAQPNTDFGGANLGSILAEQEKQSSAVLDRLTAKIKELADIFKSGFNDGLGDDFQASIQRTKDHIASIGQSLKEIFIDPSVVTSANTCLNNIAYGAGQIIGSAVSIGQSFAEFLIGGIDSYLLGSKDYIKQRIIGMFDATGEIAALFGSLGTAIADCFELFRLQVFKDALGELIGIISNTFLGALQLVLQLGRDILSVFIQPIIDNVPRIKDAFVNTITPIGTILAALNQAVKDTFDKIFEVYDAKIRPMFDAIASGFSTILSAILDAYNNYIAPVLQALADKFAEVFESRIQPLINTFLETFGSIGVMLGIIWSETLAPFFAWLIDILGAVLGPVIQTIGTLFLDAFAGLCAVLTPIMEVFGALAEWCTVNQEVVAAIAAAFVAFTLVINAQKFAALAVSGAYTIAIKAMYAWDAVMKIVKGTQAILSGAFAFFTSPLGLVALAIAAVVAIGVLLYKNWDTVKEKLGQLKDRFVDSWNGIVSTAKSMANGVLGAIQSMVNGVIKGLNFMIRSLNKIQFDVPEWVPLLGGKHFGLNINEISQVQLPRLAQGGYVKANQPQLAMIGDNKREGEIVAPESKITEAVAEGLKQVMAMLVPQQQTAVAGGDITIPIYLDGGIIDTVIVSAQNRRNLRSGGRS